LRSRTETHNRQVLRAVAENSSLKAGLQLVHDHPRDPIARGTVEDQLTEICSELGFDFLQVFDVDNQPLAGVMRQDGKIVPLAARETQLPAQGYFMLKGVTYQVSSIPVDEGQENLGSL